MKPDRMEIVVSLRYEVTRQIGYDDENHILEITGSVSGEINHGRGDGRVIDLGELRMFLVQVGNAMEAGDSLAHVFDIRQATHEVGCAVFNPSFDDLSPWVKKQYPLSNPFEDSCLCFKASYSC